MKTNVIFVIFLFIIIQFSTSCSSIADSSTKGETFYNLIKNKQFSEITKLLDNRAYVLTKKENWISGLEDIYNQRGNLVSFEKTGIFTSIEDDLTVIRLDYKVVYENGKFNESLKFIETQGSYLIVEYNFNVNKELKK